MDLTRIALATSQSATGRSSTRAPDPLNR